MAISPGSFVGQTFTVQEIVYEWDGEKWTGKSDNPSYSIPGEIKMWPNNSLPLGYLFCDGAAVSRSTYGNLFGIIGTTYGAGDGSTTFNLPDFRDRMPIGAGNLYAANASGGSKDASVISHSHTFSGDTGVESANHTHSISNSGTHGHTTSNGGYFMIETDPNPNEDPYISGSDNSWFAKGITANTAAAGDHNHGGATLGVSANHSHAFSGSTSVEGASATNANLPPYLSIYFIIKY